MINSPARSGTLAHLLKYDTTYGILPLNVESEPGYVHVGTRRIPCLSEKDPSRIDWRALGVNYVLECSGEATQRAKAADHLASGASRVLIAAPSKDADATLIPGCNLEDYKPEQHRIVSMGSCTTNCLAVTLNVLNDRFGIENGLATAVHAYTSDQRLLDGSHDDLRRARAAGQSLIPTKTGASSTIESVFPELKGKISCNAIRAPVSTVSLLNLVVSLKKRVTTDEVNTAYRVAANREMKGVLRVSEQPLVSIDFKKDPHSSIIDALSTSTVGDLVRVLAWYDNEWAYALRMIETVIHMTGRELSSPPGRVLMENVHGHKRQPISR